MLRAATVKFVSQFSLFFPRYRERIALRLQYSTVVLSIRWYYCTVTSEWRERLRTSAVTRFLIHKQRRQYRARLSSISKKVPRAISISIGKRFRVTFDVIPYFLCSLGYSAIYNTARAYSSLTKLVNNRKKTIQGLQSVPCVNIVFLDNFSDR